MPDTNHILQVALIGIGGAAVIIAIVAVIVRLTAYDAPSWFTDAETAPEDPAAKPSIDKERR